MVFSKLRIRINNLGVLQANENLLWIVHWKEPNPYSTMKLKYQLLLFQPFFFLLGYAQDYKEYKIEDFYQRIDLESGALDEDGRSIDFVFVKHQLDKGKYEVEITDGPGDLYHIKGTDYYIEFRMYYGYAGYADEGILEVGYSTYTSTFYKLE